MKRHAISGAVLALACLLSVPSASAAPTPANGTLSVASPTLSFTGGFTVSDPSGASCGAPFSPSCDTFALAVQLPADYDTTNPNARIRVVMTTDDVDYDLFVYEGATEIGSSATSTPEVVEVDAGQGNRSLSIDVLGWTATGGTYTTTVTLLPGSTGGGDGDADDDGVPDTSDSCPNTVAGTPVDASGCPLQDATGLSPRFQIHVAPPELGNDAGEPSVGYNKHTKHTMFISYVNALRQTYHEDVVPQTLPASCPALWEDKSGLLTTLNTLDPILFTDEATGRTFNSQLSGANSLFEFTDDDGDSWNPGQIGIPNGGADHQTVASGPFPASATPPTASWPAVGPKRAVYYCSQSVAAAFCSRSDDGGQTFGPGYVFKNLECGAGGLHGHVKVAPDGTVYVPDSSQCVLPIGGSAGKVITHVSENAGLTWTVRTVPESTGGAGSDPSIGIATDGTLYMCYENADSTVRMAVSHDKGVTWVNDQDIGAAMGLVQTRFPHAIAGDGDRAACAFLGTTTTGNGSSLEFDGVWHGYVATTYDGGDTYHLVNVTPGDPVQGHGGVGPDGTNRNLLDFNDLQIDDQGRTYFGFADGCTGACVRNPANNAFEAKATIVRQSGGRTLYAAFDDTSLVTPKPRFNVATPIKPAAACARADLSTRTTQEATVAWSAPDTGGSPITNYKVYRATAAAGPFAAIGDAGTSTTFVDATALPTVDKYYYRVEASNAKGIADVSNVIELPITADPVNTCEAPGQLIVLDAAGDAQGGDVMDLLWVGVAETQAFPDAFTITLKVANFTAGVPAPSSFFTLLFPLYGNLYVALDSTAGPAVFAYGTYQELPQGLLAFTQDGTLEGSSYAADGTISFIVPRALLGNLAVGADLVGFDARARIGSATANSRDTAGPASYVVRGVGGCTSGVFALANLAASALEGVAPLEVTFTVTGTPSAGANLASYTLDFGDGNSHVGTFTGGAASIAHTYTSPGLYRAVVTIRDSASVTSTNLAEQTINVLAPGAAGAFANGNNRLGGALPGLSLLVLGLMGVLRRRVKR
jgi:hypothetical protein